jgi:type I restriction enzyme S subunit
MQSRIGSIISAYDDLIENNRRRIQLLEQAGRLIYQEWFVRLRFPGHEGVRVVDGAPEGWERTSVGRSSGYLNRGISPNYDDDAEGLVINQKCIRERLLDMTKARRQKRPFGPEKQVQVGDVLINSTGEGTLGRIAQVKAEIPRCTVDSHVTIVRPSPEIGWRYFGMALMELEPHFSVMGRGATNQTELSRATIAEAPLLAPAKPIVDRFEAIVSPISQQVTNLTEQIGRLRLARDLLLPRLMSGEIEV